MSIGHAYCFLNIKGGVMKTTVSTNVALELAERGKRTLLVDMDPQGNSGRSLGLYDGDHSVNDYGRNLAAAMLGATDLTPVSTGRDNLDLVVGGEATLMVQPAYYASVLDGAPRNDVLEQALLPLASHYDVIIIDTPPRETSMQVLSLSACHGVVVPCFGTKTAVDGAERAAAVIRIVRGATNARLSILGALFVNIPLNDQQRLAGLRKDIAAAMKDSPHIFTTVIRRDVTTGENAINAGMTAREYQQHVKEQSGWFTRRRRTKPARRLAADYAAFVDELIPLMTFQGDTPLALPPGPTAAITSRDDAAMNELTNLLRGPDFDDADIAALAHPDAADDDPGNIVEAS